MRTVLAPAGVGAKGTPYVDRIWGIWGSYYNIPKTIFNLLKGDYRMLLVLRTFSPSVPPSDALRQCPNTLCDSICRQGWFRVQGFGGLLVHASLAFWGLRGHGLRV